MAVYAHNSGAIIEYTNGGSAITEGDVVVVGGMVCVAGADIANGATGILYRKGAFRLPVVTGAAFTAGLGATYIAATGLIDDAAASATTGDVTGALTCLETVASAASGARHLFLLNEGPGTVN
jgi:predicted RecA/RadA family phage recombinase